MSGLRVPGCILQVNDRKEEKYCRVCFLPAVKVNRIIMSEVEM
ncbi:MAG: hypothetical protein PHC33_01070 [Candidatus Omnitrophica bacterium]|nr:hypothetical protein [Candidatus Omnitrophota bacterium]